MPRIGRGEYDVVECVRWIIKWKDEQIAELRRGGETESSARNRLATATANLREAELARMMGEIIRIDDVVAAIADVVAASRSRLLALPRRAAAEAAVVAGDPGKAVEVERILKAIVNEALDELSTIPERIHSARAPQDRGRSARVGAVETTAGADDKRVG